MLWPSKLICIDKSKTPSTHIPSPARRARKFTKLFRHIYILATVRLITTIRSVLTFYKSFFAASFLITLLCCLLFLEFGTGILLPLHWLKLSATAIIFFYIRTYKNKEFYYYQNLGLSKTFLWSLTMSLDLALYVLLLLLGVKTLPMHHLSANSIQLTLGPRPILTDIRLHCRTGDITGLLGRNGAGKSCLLQILYGTLPATSRSVKFDDKPVSKPYQHPDLIRFLPQFNFIPKTLPLRRILDDFQLTFTDLEKQFPEFSKAHSRPIAQLSGGQRRLVELYVIICSPSQFALLDEPFTHLMPLQIEKVKELLLEHRSKKAFLLTDHLYRDVISVSDELYVLADGATHHLNNPLDIQKFAYIPPHRN
jgi:lipopolysaccharide export system ATP-binding protein